jgi:hypothetical protein
LITWPINILFFLKPLGRNAIKAKRMGAFMLLVPSIDDPIYIWLEI